MGEVWKEVPGYNGKYFASTSGEILSLSRKVKFGERYRWTETKILKERDNGHGYKTVRMDGKLEYVHRIVAITFIDNPFNLPQVNHIDENKSNNCAENLEWCSPKYNCNYGTGIERELKAKSKRFKTLNVDTGDIYDSPMDASRKTGIHHDGISRTCNGKSKTAGGYRWRYLNER